MIFVKAEPGQWVSRRYFAGGVVSLFPVVFDTPLGLGHDSMTLIDVYNRPLGYRTAWLNPKNETDAFMLLFECHRDGMAKGAMVL